MVRNKNIDREEGSALERVLAHFRRIGLIDVIHSISEVDQAHHRLTLDNIDAFYNAAQECKNDPSIKFNLLTDCLYVVASYEAAEGGNRFIEHWSINLPADKTQECLDKYQLGEIIMF